MRTQTVRLILAISIALIAGRIGYKSRDARIELLERELARHKEAASRARDIAWEESQRRKQILFEAHKIKRSGTNPIYVTATGNYSTGTITSGEWRIVCSVCGGGGRIVFAGPEARTRSYCEQHFPRER
jgi:hypothetical protein